MKPDKKNILLFLLFSIFLISIISFGVYFVSLQYFSKTTSPQIIKIKDEKFGSTSKSENIVKVAFFGDQGLTENSKAVLRMIKNEKTDLVVQLGDLDYADNPDAWADQIQKYLGNDTDYLTILGNHEAKKWDEYKEKIDDQVKRAKILKCNGENGVEALCTYKNISFIVTSPNLTKMDHEGFIKNSLQNSPFTWNVCAWHHNQKAMQLGEKQDETGWGVYEECRKGGAIVATAHEHSYSRTHLLSSFPSQTIATTSNILSLEKDKTFAFVSGLGGQSIRPQILSGPWWAKVYTSTQNASSGALFCNFGIMNDPKKARCYFKDIKGNVVDNFEVRATK